MDSDFYGLTATVEADFDFGTLTVIPAYRESDVNFVSYLPGFSGQTTEDNEQTSLEVRLTSASDRRLRHVLGVYYFEEQQDAENFFIQGTISTTRFTPHLETESKAVFGQATFDLTETFRLVAGARYTEESREQLTALASGGLPGPVFPPLGPPFPGALDFSKTTWKAGVEWDAASEVLVYANVATGFKAGGFFVAAPPNNTFLPEELTAYTIGAKSRFLDDRMQLNLEAYYWDYEDQQISFVGGITTPTGVAPGLVTVNAGAARMQGVETEFLFSVGNGLFSANVQYLDGEYESLVYTTLSASGAPIRSGCTVNGSRLANPGTPSPARLFDLDCSGMPTINSPEWSANLGYEHTFSLGGDMSFLIGVRSRLESSRYVNIDYLPEQHQDSYTTSDAYVTLFGANERWSLTGFVSNIEDEAVISGAFSRPVLQTVYASLRPPQTYGVARCVPLLGGSDYFESSTLVPAKRRSRSTSQRIAGSASRWRCHCIVSRSEGKPGGGSSTRSGSSSSYSRAWRVCMVAMRCVPTMRCGTTPKLGAMTSTRRWLASVCVLCSFSHLSRMLGWSWPTCTTTWLIARYCSSESGSWTTVFSLQTTQL